MARLMVTRFKNTTWNENIRWKENNNYSGCIYNSPVHIKETIPLQITIYVIEMNNDRNKIVGFGKIMNKVYTDRKYRIYDERNYNRYTYRGIKRINIEEIKDDDIINKIGKLEKRLFKGKGHLKRGQGITQLPNEIEKEYLNFIIEIIFNNNI
mgnify:FL=1